MNTHNFSISTVVPVGSLVNARFKGNYHDATVVAVEQRLKCKVAFMKGGEYTVVGVDSRHIEGNLDIDKEVTCEIDGSRIPAVLKSVIDVSIYKLDFYDGDFAFAKRRQLLVKKLPNQISPSDSGRHSFSASKVVEETTHHHDTLNRSRDETLVPLPGKRNTFNSLLSSLDSMDPSESSLIMNALEMSFNDSKHSNPTRSRSASSVKSPAELPSSIQNKQEIDPIRSYSSSTEMSEENEPLSVGSGEKAAEKLIFRHIGQSVLLKVHNSLNLSDLLEIVHIEAHSKIIGFPFIKYPSIKESNVDIYQLLKSVTKMGGSDFVSETKQWKEVAINLKLQNAVPATFCCLKRFFNRWLQPYVIHKSSKTSKKCCLYVTQVADFFSKQTDKPDSDSNEIVVDLTPYQSSSESTSKKHQKHYKNEPLDAVPSHSNKKSGNTHKKRSVPTTPIRKNNRSHPIHSSDEMIDRSNDEEYNFERNDDDGSKTDSSFSSSNSKKQIDNTERGSRNSEIHPIKIGTSVMVRYGQSNKLDYYPAKVVAVRPTSSSFDYFVHYKGWNSRFDEWIKAKFVELHPEQLESASKSPKSDSVTPRAQHSTNKDSSRDLSRAQSSDEAAKSSLHKDANSRGVVVQKRPKGRPPTKHLQQAANKPKPSSQSNPTNQEEGSKRAFEKNRSASNEASANSVPLGVVSAESRNSHQTHHKESIYTPSKSSQSKVVLGATSRHKSEHETSPNSLLIPNIGSAGHRRTRNSLEDAILNAVLEQSVLESNKTSDPASSNVHSNDNDEVRSVQSNNPGPIQEIMASIIGSSGGTQSDNEFVASQGRHSATQHNPISAHLKAAATTTTSGPTKPVGSNRGRKPKATSRKSSPSRKSANVASAFTSELASHPEVTATYTSSKYDATKKSKSANDNMSDVNELKSSKKDDSYNPPNYYKYSDSQDLRRKRSADTMDRSAKDPRVGRPMKHPKNESHLTTTRKAPIGSDNEQEELDTTSMVTKRPKTSNSTEYIPKNKNLTKSTINFITKINNMTEYFSQKDQSLEEELTSKASLDNIRKIEAFLSEIQQAYQNVKRKLRKLERGRKKYLQTNNE